MLVQCLTDNGNRAASDVRTAFSRNGGSMADPGSVSYLFHRKGVVIVEKKGVTEDDVLSAVLDAGAEEVNDLGESIEVVSEPTDMVATRQALQDAGIDYDSADVAFLPSVEVDLDEDHAATGVPAIVEVDEHDNVIVGTGNTLINTEKPAPVQSKPDTPAPTPPPRKTSPRRSASPLS